MASSNSQLTNFPPEILVRIFCHIDSIKELLLVSRTCRRWRSIILDTWFQQHRFREFTRRHLIGHWKFENANNLGHDSSGIVQDRYTFTGQPRQDTCFLGFCASFDDRSSIDIPVYDLSLYQTDNFCVAVWVLTSRMTYDHRTAVGAWKPDNNHWLHLGHSNYYRAENQVIISPALIQFECAGERLETNKWFHLVALVSRFKQTLYVNGKLANTVDMSKYTDNLSVFKKHLVTDEMIKNWKEEKMQLPHTLHIGAKSFGFNFWLGEVGDVSVWNRHLEPHEIKAIYEQKVTVDKVNISEHVLNKMSLVVLPSDSPSTLKLLCVRPTVRP
ncbi:unnamed protein product [Rotaria sp. Silwood1]|nr:unnamed protein product [Rotaria sp. Silwood1]CAF3786922.1 unnamed protein product [Rotaria sp. Silwood1]CAF4685959.1 unnamed protein product [Rotaria sp. Silwood1]CAF4927529.1 unnamed protein product [Rotaria sp. Silwood1]